VTHDSFSDRHRIVGSDLPGVEEQLRILSKHSIESLSTALSTFVALLIIVSRTLEYEELPSNFDQEQMVSEKDIALVIERFMGELELQLQHRQSSSFSLSVTVHSAHIPICSRHMPCGYHSLSCFLVRHRNSIRSCSIIDSQKSQRPKYGRSGRFPGYLSRSRQV
jgi:hypothetical protein